LTECDVPLSLPDPKDSLRGTQSFATAMVCELSAFCLSKARIIIEGRILKVVGGAAGLKHMKMNVLG
jgi:hypothetical protein